MTATDHPQSHLELHELAAWLTDNGRASEILDMLEKPWKYADDWTECRSSVDA